jgi:hypothetical protein
MQSADKFIVVAVKVKGVFAGHLNTTPFSVLRPLFSGAAGWL